MNLLLLPLMGIGFMAFGVGLDCWTTLSFMRKEGVELEAHAIPRNLYKKYGPKGVIGLDVGFCGLTVLCFSPFDPILQCLAFIVMGILWLFAGVRNLVLAK